MRALAALLLALAALFGLAACGDSNTTDKRGARQTSGAGEKPGAQSGAGQAGKAAASMPTIVVRGGEPLGGVQELAYSAGDAVRFRVQSDVADEIHVHGYDLMQDVAAGGTVSFSFPADIEGIFEVELEEHQTEIAELRVNP